MKIQWFAAAAALALAACSQPAPAPEAAAPPAPEPVLTEAEATALADKLTASVGQKDAAATVALFTSDAVLFDAAKNAMITDSAANLAATEEMFKGEPTVTTNARKVQVLDADTFIDTALVTVDFKKNGKPTWSVLRVTDVWQKQADGSWKVVNEHASVAPEIVKARLPALSGAAPTPAEEEAPPLGGVSSAPAPTEMPKQ